MQEGRLHGSAHIYRQQQIQKDTKRKWGGGESVGRKGEGRRDVRGGGGVEKGEGVGRLKIPCPNHLGSFGCKNSAVLDRGLSTDRSL